MLHTHSPADAPTHSMFCYVHAIINPRPMRMIVSTACNLSTHTYITRTSALVPPNGSGSPAQSAGAPAECIRRASPLESLRYLFSSAQSPHRARRKNIAVSAHSSADRRESLFSWSRNHVFGTDSCRRYGIENLLMRKYQFEWPAHSTVRSSRKSNPSLIPLRCNSSTIARL